MQAASAQPVGEGAVAGKESEPVKASAAETEITKTGATKTGTSAPETAGVGG